MLFGRAPDSSAVRAESARAPGEGAASSEDQLERASWSTGDNAATAGQSDVAPDSGWQGRIAARYENRNISRRVAGLDWAGGAGEDRLRQHASCGWTRRFSGVEVEVVGPSATTPYSTARFSGLMSCRSPWICAVCEVPVNEKRAIEFTRIAADWQAAGNIALMTVITYPHCAGDQLDSLVSDGWRWLTSHRQFKELKARWPSFHWARTVEHTHGADHGWHPHVNIVLLIGADGLDDTAEARALADVAATLRPLWDRFLAKRGYPPANPLKGVDVRPCPDAGGAGAYIFKSQWGIGREMFRGAAKTASDGHRTYFQIVDDYGSTESADDLALIREYQLATLGHRRVSYSKGFRQAFPSEILQASDDDLDDMPAEDPAPTVVRVAEIPGYVWDQLRHEHDLPALILIAAVSAGRYGVARLLAQRRYLLDQVPGRRPP